MTPAGSVHVASRGDTWHRCDTWQHRGRCAPGAPSPNSNLPNLENGVGGRGGEEKRWRCLEGKRGNCLEWEKGCLEWEKGELLRVEKGGIAHL